METVYLSYGGGVNSTALMLLLKEWGINFEAVFVDHGGDFPGTYEYVNYIQDQGFPITILKPQIEGYSDLYQYCLDKGLIPSRRFRWCTDKFKMRPMHKYFKRPAQVYMGIDWEERHRIKEFDAIYNPKNITYYYPLYEENYTRQDCKSLIKEKGLKVPIKSCCFFCFNQRKSQIRKMYSEHRELYDKVRALEMANKRDRRSILLKPFEYYAPEGTLSLLEYMDKRPQEVEITYEVIKRPRIQTIQKGIQ